MIRADLGHFGQCLPARQHAACLGERDQVLGIDKLSALVKELLYRRAAAMTAPILTNLELHLLGCALCLLLKHTLRHLCCCCCRLLLLGQREDAYDLFGGSRVFVLGEAPAAAR